MRSKPAWLRYSMPLPLVAIAMFAAAKAQPVLHEISPIFLVAVMLGAWFGGFGPALLTTAAVGWISAHYFYDKVIGLDDVMRLGIFLMAALLISFLLTMRERAENQLRLANEHLETRVLDRTRELESSNRKVRESEEGLKALIEGVTDCAICMLDQEGQIVQWNSGAQRIQGYTDAEIHGKYFSIFFPAHRRDDRRLDQALQQAARLGRHEDEGWRVRKDGSLFWASVIITPLQDEHGELRGFAHVARDITKLKRLEKEVIEISEAEQRRIGQDLHDGLGQELTGLAFLSQNVARRLAESSRPEATELGRISGLINHTIEQTRDLAKGLSPVEWGPDGLVAALQNLSVRIRELYKIPCEFRRGRATAIESHVAAVHMYRIAQEALSNAARHSEASNIWISIDGEAGDVILSIEDNGKGLNESRPASKGMGLHLMPYRARIIGASFEACPREGGGTVIRCIYRKLADPGGTDVTAATDTAA